MAGEIVTTVVGNLVADPTLKYLPSGVAVVEFTVANNPRVPDKQAGGFKDGATSYVYATAWREFAENIAESLTRGARVVMQGKFRQEFYEKDGEKRSSWKFDVDAIGPDLRYAKAKVNKVTRSQAGEPVEDPWGSAPAAGSAGFGDQPPF
jgi:single-strand DNA-binding protein